NGAGSTSFPRVSWPSPTALMSLAATMWTLASSIRGHAEVRGVVRSRGAGSDDRGCQQKSLSPVVGMQQGRTSHGRDRGGKTAAVADLEVHRLWRVRGYEASTWVAGV